MEIINAHVHVYPDKIALKAAQSMGAFYNAPIRHNGTIADLLKENEENGISRCLIHSVATTVRQVTSINNFIYEQMQQHSEFIGFMALHQDMDKHAIEDEVQRCIELGFKGVKLHPDCQKFNIDDKDMDKIYDTVAGKLPILMHMGDTQYDNSSITRLLNILNDKKDLQVIAAHMGGYSHWDEVGLYHNAKYDNFHFDTSSSLHFLGPYAASMLINEFGAKKFFFGTDYPMWMAKDEISYIMSLPIMEKDKELIFSKNLKDFLQL